MSTLDSLLPSRFLKKEDVSDQPMTLTIAGFEKGTIKNEDGKEDPATFLKFEETDKSVIVKAWTVENLKEIFGDDAKPESIKGGSVEAFHDPSVKFGSKRVGGLRLRKPAGVSKTAPF